MWLLMLSDPLWICIVYENTAAFIDIKNLYDLLIVICLFYVCFLNTATMFDVLKYGVRWGY